MCEGEGRAVVRERTRRLFLPSGGPGRIFSRAPLVCRALALLPGAGWELGG